MLYRGDNWRSNVGKYKRTDEWKAIASNCKKEWYRNNPEKRLNKGSFKKGQPSVTKGKKSITDGVHNHFIDTEDFSYWEAKGWKYGNTQKHKKR